MVNRTISGGTVALPAHTTPKTFDLILTATSDPENLNNITGGISGDSVRAWSADASMDPNLVHNAGGAGQLLMRGGADIRLLDINWMVHLFMSPSSTFWSQGRG